MATAPTETIEISRMTPGYLRWGLALFGGVFAALAARELWAAVWPPSIVTPFFSIMLGIGVFAGGALAIAALFEPDETWSIAPGRLTIHQSMRGMRRRFDYGPAHIASIKLETSDWDSRPATFGLTIQLVGGKVLKSPEIGTERKAADITAMLNPHS